jgi:hypothetical protein
MRPAGDLWSFSRKLFIFTRARLFLSTPMLLALVVSGVLLLAGVSGQLHLDLTCKRGLKVATWNVAAINNNPFEYWITYPDPQYVDLMNGVQEFVSSPGAMDVPVHQVFTEAMAKDLFEEMAKKNVKGLDEVEKRWISEYKDRKIISEFIKDKALGKKRLASMPDRVTNTINTAEGWKVMRPTVINCAEAPIDSVEHWWRQWRDFMFVNRYMVASGSKEPKQVGSPWTMQRERIYRALLPFCTADVCCGNRLQVQPFEMLQPILKSKYPDITEAEQDVSIPLQALCLAIFDAIQIHMMNHVAPTAWQPIRKTICQVCVFRFLFPRDSPYCTLSRSLPLFLLLPPPGNPSARPCVQKNVPGLWPQRTNSNKPSAFVRHACRFEK